MTSLELLWTFITPTMFGDETMKSVWSLAQQPPTPSSSAQQSGNSSPTPFHDLCEMIPRTFPNVRRLYVALQAYIVPPPSFQSTDVIGSVEQVVLGPIEDMFRRMMQRDQGGSTKEFSLAIQRGGWQVIVDRAAKRITGERRLSPQGDGGGGESSRERLWRPLGEAEGEGYWLRPGWDDIEVMGSQYWMFDIWRTGGFRGEF
jgi:hypothetical protein